MIKIHLRNLRIASEINNRRNHAITHAASHESTSIFSRGADETFSHECIDSHGLIAPDRSVGD